MHKHGKDSVLTNSWQSPFFILEYSKHFGI
jgi:hypothetical protein